MTRLEKMKLPTVTAILSFIFLLGITLLSNPAKDVILVLPFFLTVYSLLISILWVLITIQKGSVPGRARQKIVLGSTCVTVLLMLSSAQSLSLVDFIIFILITFGLFFYFSRR